MKKSKSILILTLIMILTITFGGCETQGTSRQKDKGNATIITETTNIKGNTTIKPSGISDDKESNTEVSLSSYIGKWHINEDNMHGDNEDSTELEIVDINNSRVIFNLAFFRIAGIYDVSAKIEGNIAKFYQAPIGGTLEFYDNGILVSIDKSELKHIKTGKLNFNSKSKSMKQKFKDKLDAIQKELEAESTKVGKDGNTDNGISAYAKNNYQRWDNALNEIYGVLQENLSVDDMKQLQTEEIKWIGQRENAAKDAENQQGQGSQLGQVAYNSTSAKLTKDRCYDLVEKYIKNIK